MPKTGTWTDKNATFGGIFGNVVNGHVDLSVASWVRTTQVLQSKEKDPILYLQLVNVERSGWVEFLSPADNEREITVINSLKQSIDVDLFLRPFTRSASLTI